MERALTTASDHDDDC